MHNTTNAPEMVTQADRDAAADLLGGAAPDGLRQGRQDSLSLVQAFARHRHQSASPSGLVDSEINELIERLEKRMARWGVARCHETVAFEYADYSVMEDVGNILAELKELSSKPLTNDPTLVRYIDDRIVQFYAGEMPYSGLAVRELTHVRHLIIAPGHLPPDHPLHSMSTVSRSNETEE